MRNSLIFKLTGAFLLVIAIGALMVSVLTSQATRDAFSVYTTRSSQVWAARLSGYLSDFYTQSNSWEGVNAFLESGLTMEMLPGAGRGMGSGKQNFGGNSFFPGFHVILTDAGGVVISDSDNHLLNTVLPERELQAGIPVLVDDTQVGTVVVRPEDFSNSNTLAGEFIASVNRAIVSSAAIAALIALVLGAALLLQIVRPLRQLNRAAASIAGGDLNQRVDIRSQDELGQLGATFNQMAENLSQSETQRRNMVADIAHELRTPLAAIQGTLEGVQDGIFPMDEEQISALYAETTLLNRLVGDLKLLSLAEAGQLSLTTVETDISALMAQIVERSRPLAEMKKIRLEASVEPNLAPVKVDTDRITQVVTNLIGNAVYYTPDGGKITLQVAAVPAESALQISVSDTGPGIDPADLPQIFDRFYRTDKSRSRNSGGSGLGLAIAKQLVEAHGGRIWAESPAYQDADGRESGTKVIFTLPY